LSQQKVNLVFSSKEVPLETSSWNWTFLPLSVAPGLLLLLLWLSLWHRLRLVSCAEVFTTLPAHNGKQKA